MQTAIVNEEKLHALLGTVVNEMGAAANGALVIIGDKLGLYKAIQDAGSVTSHELAKQTATSERYVREWLAAQAASGYITYDPLTTSFSMTPEQAMVFADSKSPVIMTGGFYTAASVYADEPRVREAFKTGEGVDWGDHHNCLFCGVEKFFRPSYEANLIQQWIPAIEGMEDKLKAGIKVADVGCGQGASTMIMAKAFPNSHFTGIDLHEGSIRHAQQEAQKMGLSNIRFVAADAKYFAGEDFGFVTTFDCLHDTGDPEGISRHLRNILASDGSWMIVEPFANDRLEDNLNPVGRTFYAFSTMICVPTSLSQEVGAALGAQAGAAQIESVVKGGGFGQFRTAVTTPFNLIYEAKL